MSQQVKHIPGGYPTLSPSLVIRGAAKAIEFYQAVFGAKERFRFEGPGGVILHAELQFGDSVVMLHEENPAFPPGAPQSFGGTPVTLYLFVPDVDATVETAVRHGARLARAPETQFYGDRNATVEDPFGHLWDLATHVEDVPPEEMQRRLLALTGAQG